MAGLKPTGRTGMDLWQILVLGVVRLGLDANFDRLEDLSNHHMLIRQMLGVPQTPWGAESQVFNHQTLRDNIALFDEALLQEINALVAAQGRAVFKKNDRAALAPLAVKVDSYVLETDVHFPTDLNLLWDAGASAWICWKAIATLMTWRAGAKPRTGAAVSRAWSDPPAKWSSAAGRKRKSANGRP